jgi:hypothetical protein
MTSPHTPEPAAQERPLNASTVHVIIRMIDDRRELLTTQWAVLERGSRESGENLAADSALADLKWAIVDALGYRDPKG